MSANGGRKTSTDCTSLPGRKEGSRLMKADPSSRKSREKVEGEIKGLCIILETRLEEGLGTTVPRKIGRGRRGGDKKGGKSGGGG